MSQLPSTLSNVDPSDRHAFVQALAHVAALDGSVHVDEEDAVNDLLDSWDLSRTQRSEIERIMANPGDQSIENLTATFDDSNTKFLLVQELVRLALADGTYDEDERDGIARIADRIDLPAEQFKEIEEWAERGSVWRRGSVDEADTDRLDDVVNGGSGGDADDFNLDDIDTTGSDLDDIGTDEDYDYDEFDEDDLEE
jgi:uncharacterized tellurite resistance protein B-like protein